MNKLQIPSSKLQRNPKLQTPHTEASRASEFLEPGACPRRLCFMAVRGLGLVRETLSDDWPRGLVAGRVRGEQHGGGAETGAGGCLRGAVRRGERACGPGAGFGRAGHG